MIILCSQYYDTENFSSISIIVILNIVFHDNIVIPYRTKVWREKSLAKLLQICNWRKKFGEFVTTMQFYKKPYNISCVT